MGAQGRAARSAGRQGGGQGLPQQSRHRLSQIRRRDDRAGPRDGEDRQLHQDLRRRRGDDRGKTSASRWKKRRQSWRNTTPQLPFVKQALADRPAEGGAHRHHRALWAARMRHWKCTRQPWQGQRRLLVRRGTAPRHRSRASLARPDAASRQDVQALNALIQGDAAIHAKNWMLLCFRDGHHAVASNA